MRFCELFDSYIDTHIASDAEARDAIAHFKKNIPGRVLQMDFDASHSNKQGIKDGEKVYKLGLDIASGTVFIEFFENFNQGQPTMAVYVDRARHRVTINAWQVDKRFAIRYTVDNGAVRKAVTFG